MDVPSDKLVFHHGVGETVEDAHDRFSLFSFVQIQLKFAKHAISGRLVVSYNAE